MSEEIIIKGKVIDTEMRYTNRGVPMTDLFVAVGGVRFMVALVGDKAEQVHNSSNPGDYIQVEGNNPSIVRSKCGYYMKIWGSEVGNEGKG